MAKKTRTELNTQILTTIHDSGNTQSSKTTGAKLRTLETDIIDSLYIKGDTFMDLLPTSDGTYELGSSGKRWKDAYITNIYTYALDAGSITTSSHGNSTNWKEAYDRSITSVSYSSNVITFNTRDPLKKLTVNLPASDNYSSWNLGAPGTNLLPITSGTTVYFAASGTGMSVSRKDATITYTYKHYSRDAETYTASGSNVISSINVDIEGHVTSVGTRSLTAADVGAVSKSLKINTSTGLKGGGTLKSDLDLSIDSDIVAQKTKNETWSGTITASSFALGSDRKWKTNVRTIGKDIDTENIPLYRYKKDGKDQFGAMADEVKPVHPYLVEYNEKLGGETVNYIGLLVAKVANAEARLKEFDERLEEIDLLIKDLKL